jgi:hypothetical protein
VGRVLFVVSAQGTSSALGTLLMSTVDSFGVVRRRGGRDNPPQIVIEVDAPGRALRQCNQSNPRTGGKKASHQQGRHAL